MKAGLVQVNSLPGDFSGNREKLIVAYQALVAQGAEVVVTPELALTGFAPQDLLFTPRFAEQAEAALAMLAAEIGSVPLVVGHIVPNQNIGRPFYNAALVLHEGGVAAEIGKTLSTTPDLRDEARTFDSPHAADAPALILELGGEAVSIIIGDEIEDDEHLATLKEAGATALLHLGASSLIAADWQRPAQRAADVARNLELKVVSAQPVGGHVSTIYPGGSVAVSSAGEFTAIFPLFVEAQAVADLSGPALPLPERETVEVIHDALVLALRDYVRHSGFKSVVLGLSGGIDSAVVAALAVEALGKENVHGVSMPTEFSSEGSVNDALALARNLGIDCPVLSIQQPLEAFRQLMATPFTGTQFDATEENMQPRLRGMVVMAFSNKFGHLALCTGNKSELAMGYCTLYGDMAGGYALISDLYKTQVYELAHYLNRNREVIPTATIEKAPSAELKPGQVDQDTLPPYDQLDEILGLLIEGGQTPCSLAAQGYDAELLNSIERRMTINEYKRIQAAPGPQISYKGFGPGRRLPLIHRFKDLA